MSKSLDTANTEDRHPLTINALTVKPKITPTYDVHRSVLTHEALIQQTGYTARDKSLQYALQQCWHTWSFIGLFSGVLPILKWLPNYSLKTNLLGDIIAGITVAIMHIPHGMAYGILAGVSPNNGLYMAIFPCLVYMILGTSRHISIGTFAVCSLMTLKVVDQHTMDEKVAIHLADNHHNIVTPLEVVTTLAFTVGLILLVMCLLRLGILSSLLSEPLINGFTTGAACHVVTSQLRDMFGVQIPRQKSAFKIIWTLYDLGRALPQTNLVTLTFCLSIMAFMTMCNEVMKPIIKKWCSMPLPAELIAVIGGTLISMYTNMADRYNVIVIGEIPYGLPAPMLPRFDLIPNLLIDGVAIAVVTYSVVMSMGLLFAKKHNYQINANQELFAMGMGNIVCGFFSCIPLACSLSRSLIQEQTGGSTQFVSLVSASLILITLYWAGPFFRYLPRCVLAGVVIVALKSIFMQVKDLKKYAKQGKLEMLQWLVTFITVVFIDIDYGLLAGLLLSILNLHIKGLRPYHCLLGFVPEASTVYVDIHNHTGAFEVPETKIFRYYGSLNFASALCYRKALYETIGLMTPAQTVKTSIHIHKYSTASNRTDHGAGGSNNRAGGGDGSLIMSNGSTISNLSSSFRFLILDLSMLGHFDTAGGQMLSDIMQDMKNRNVRLFLASPTDRVYDSLVHSMGLGEGPFEIFPTLHDAVEYANACRIA